MKIFDLSILPQAQLALWPKLKKVPGKFVLYGGTAIALRIVHRESIDFDFFTSDDFVADNLVREMPFLQTARRIQDSRNTLTVLYDVTGYDCPVRLSFFGGLQLGRIKPPEKADNGIWIASLLDLFGMKCATISQRVEAKDYIDIYAILNMPEFSLEHGLAAARAIYGKQYNAVLTLKSLSYFKGGNLKTLSDDVKQYLVDAVKNCDLATVPKMSAQAVIGEEV
jgi:hypothetical protein